MSACSKNISWKIHTSCQTAWLKITCTRMIVGILRIVNKSWLKIPGTNQVLYPELCQSTHFITHSFISDHENSNWTQTEKPDLHPTEYAIRQCYGSKLCMHMHKNRAFCCSFPSWYLMLNFLHAHMQGNENKNKKGIYSAFQKHGNWLKDIRFVWIMNDTYIHRLFQSVFYCKPTES